MQSDASKELPIFQPTFIIFASSIPEIPCKSDGGSVGALDELAISVEELSDELEEFSVELEELSAELEELELSAVEEPELLDVPTLSVIEEPEEFSLTVPPEHPEKHATAITAAIITKIFLFKNNTSIQLFENILPHFARYVNRKCGINTKKLDKMNLCRKN